MFKLCLERDVVLRSRGSEIPSSTTYPVRTTSLGSNGYQGVSQEAPCHPPADTTEGGLIGLAACVFGPLQEYRRVNAPCSSVPHPGKLEQGTADLPELDFCCDCHCPQLTGEETGPEVPTSTLVCSTSNACPTACRTF